MSREGDALNLTSKSFHLRWRRREGEERRRGIGLAPRTPLGFLSRRGAYSAPSKPGCSIVGVSGHSSMGGSPALPVLRRRDADGLPPAGRPGKGPPRRPDCRNPARSDARGAREASCVAGRLTPATWRLLPNSGEVAAVRQGAVRGRARRGRRGAKANVWKVRLFVDVRGPFF